MLRFHLASPGAFTILGRFSFESPLSTANLNVQFLSLFHLNDGEFSPGNAYFKSENTPNKLNINGQIYTFGTYFAPTDSTLIDEIVLAVQFAPVGPEFDVSMYVLIRQTAGYQSHLVFSRPGQTLSSFRLRLTVTKSPLLQTKLYHLRVQQPGPTISTDKPSFIFNWRVLFYRLTFFQEPVGSKLLFNRS